MVITCINQPREHINAAVKWVIIGLRYGLSPVRWTNACFLESDLHENGQ